MSTAYLAAGPSYTTRHGGALAGRMRRRGTPCSLPPSAYSMLNVPSRLSVLRIPRNTRLATKSLVALESVSMLPSPPREPGREFGLLLLSRSLRSASRFLRILGVCTPFALAGSPIGPCGRDDFPSSSSPPGLPLPS